MMTEKAKIVDPKEVTEVFELLNVERQIRALIDSNPVFYTTLATLSAQRNQLLDSAEVRVKELGVTCGPFVKLSESTKINPEKLFEELGESVFKDLGGYTETVVDYKVDRTRLLAFHKSGAIPKEVADACIKLEQRYKHPDPYLLP
jgi:hypothetical protein